MNTSRIEELLEKLIEKQDELIGRIDSLETSIELHLVEARSELTEVKELLSGIEGELNWVQEHSFAKMVYDSLSSIELGKSR